VSPVADGDRRIAAASSSVAGVTLTWDVLKDGAHLGSFLKRTDAVVFIAGHVTGEG
jgi:hypothetical protein